MTIAILPARLANQIAAGEVVERPASVVKELVENSLDAGATRIQIDIEKGGSKRIRIIDNGSGIAKDQLTLALSRHATSKIHNLDDLEAISSLGFRGEALASISSVARLSLTSKPVNQDAAWQAHAEGREMDVVLQPAAHPDGTTIDVTDLFFNTPARRKFLRTEKTEFAHIEEVIKRIALACFNVTFVLNHNGKQIKHFRAVHDKSNYIKRIGNVCGQSFINNALAIDCHHDDIHLWGWVATPSFTRNQNDLCYSYVNGRMMRDKLINHAIRQAYGEFIGNDVYPAFVLFLELDYKEVDVNVHPAKHEVRFHQGRYVHDFIYSVCHQALVEQIDIGIEQHPIPAQYEKPSDDYIKPLQLVTEPLVSPTQRNTATSGYSATNFSQPSISKAAVNSYQQLMTPSEQINKNHHVDDIDINSTQANLSTASLVESNEAVQLVDIYQEQYLLYREKSELRLCAIATLAQYVQTSLIERAWGEGLVGQPLLLPVKLGLSLEQKQLVEHFQELLSQSGIVVNIQQDKLQIRQFPALLREQNVTASFDKILLKLNELKSIEQEYIKDWQYFLAALAIDEKYTLAVVKKLWLDIANITNDKFSHYLRLNSVTVDLTSMIEQLN